jgi:transposase
VALQDGLRSSDAFVLRRA